MNSLKIVPIQSKTPYQHPPVQHSVLPQHEFSMLIVAPKGSGKTNFICNLLLNHYKSYFHNVLICSPTIDNDEKWDVVKETKHVLKENKKLQKIILRYLKKGEQNKSTLPIIVHQSGASYKDKEERAEKEKYHGKIAESNFFSNLDDLPPKIAEQQKVIHWLREMGYDQQSKYLADRLLVVLDDQAGMFRNANFNNPIVNYVIKHRHSNSSLIIVTQAYKAVPKTIRTNCNALILFDIPSLAELKSVWEEYPEGHDWEEWYELYKYATAKPYDFMYINNKFEKEHRIFRNFEQELHLFKKTTPKKSVPYHTQNEASEKTPIPETLSSAKKV